MKTIYKILLVAAALNLLGSCATNSGLPVGTVIESKEDCFVKTRKEHVRIDCPPGYVEPWFYEDDYPPMTGEERQITLAEFREAQMDEEELIALEQSLDGIVDCSPDEQGSVCRQKMISNPKYLEARATISNQRWWVVDGLNRVLIWYRNETGYPELYAGASAFNEDKSVEFREKMTDVILTDFLGENYKEYSPSLNTVTAIVAIAVFVENEEQFKRLLDDPRITLIMHVGDVIELEEIISDS